MRSARRRSWIGVRRAMQGAWAGGLPRSGPVHRLPPRPLFHRLRLPRHLASPAVRADPNHDPLFAAPLSLTEGEMSDLVAFLEALRGAPVADAFAPPQRLP